MQRQTVPSTDVRCMTTANRRASATMAFWLPVAWRHSSLRPSATTISAHGGVPLRRHSPDGRQMAKGRRARNTVSCSARPRVPRKVASSRLCSLRRWRPSSKLSQMGYSAGRRGPHSRLRRCASMPSRMVTGRLARRREISLGSTQYSMTNGLSMAQRKCSEAAVLMSVVQLWLQTLRPRRWAWAPIGEGQHREHSRIEHVRHLARRTSKRTHEIEGPSPSFDAEGADASANLRLELKAHGVDPEQQRHARQAPRPSCGSSPAACRVLV